MKKQYLDDPFFAAWKKPEEAPEDISIETIPLGKHKGKSVRSLDRNQFSGLFGGWNASPRRLVHPFFEVIQKERERRIVHCGESFHSTVKPAPKAFPAETVPHGRYKGRNIRTLRWNEFGQLLGGWNKTPKLKAHPFFEVIRNELDRRKGRHLSGAN